MSVICYKRFFLTKASSPQPSNCENNESRFFLSIFLFTSYHIIDHITHFFPFLISICEYVLSVNTY